MYINITLIDDNDEVIANFETSVPSIAEEQFARFINIMQKDYGNQEVRF